MGVGSLVVIGVLAVAAFYIIAIYNRLVNLKHGVTKAWGNIDVLLKQRNEELPKLVETCKQFMAYEGETLQRIVEARSAAMSARASGDIAKLGVAEGALRSGLGSLFALAENYPELKANESFQHLQARVTNLENTIADRREFYNETVNRNNVGIEEFPDVIIANMFNFGSAKLLEFEAHELEDVNMKALFQA